MTATLLRLTLAIAFAACLVGCDDGAKQTTPPPAKTAEPTKAEPPAALQAEPAAEPPPTPAEPAAPTTPPPNEPAPEAASEEVTTASGIKLKIANPAGEGEPEPDQPAKAASEEARVPPELGVERPPDLPPVGPDGKEMSEGKPAVSRPGGELPFTGVAKPKEDVPSRKADKPVPLPQSTVSSTPGGSQAKPAVAATPPPAKADESIQVSRTYWPNGKPKFEIPVIVEDGKAMRHGKYRRYYDNGDLWEETDYVAGMRHGRSAIFYRKDDGGGLMSEAGFVEDKEHGLSYTYYQDGTKSSEQGYVEGVRNGLDRFWYPSGQIMFEAEILNGKMNGIAIKYDEDGNVEQMETYVDGVRQ